MVGANELRIGNLVKYKYDLAEFVIIKGIDENHVWFDNLVTHDYILHDDIEPIILTEEILLKCGFEKIGDVDYSISCSINGRKSHIEINLEHEACIDIYTINGEEKTGAWVNTNNKHLHQLQNLFYSLCGQELEINL